MANFHTCQIKFHTLKVVDAQEESIFSDGDEPYFVFFGIRSRPNMPGSTQVFWGGHLDDEWAEGVDDGDQKSIPQQMGILNFPDVTLATATEVLSSGQMPEILGFVGIAIESDATPFSSIRSLMNDVRGVIFEQVKKLVEEGQLDPQNPDPAIQEAVQKVKNSLELNTLEKIKLFLKSFGDPDDVIGIQTSILVAGDSSLQPFVAAELVKQKDLQLDFAGDGANYRVHGFIEITSQQPWSSQGGKFQHIAPTAIAWGSNRLDIFGIGMDDAIWHQAWDGTQWSDWTSRGGKFQHIAPTAVAWGPNRLDIFGIGMDDAIWHQAWDGTQWV